MRNKSPEQIENQLREQFESSYKERLRTMQAMFEVRYQTLNDAIGSVYDRIKKDEVLSTMYNDRTTSIHMDERIKQVFSQVVTEQRETIFKKLGMQISNLKFENQQLSRQNRKLKESMEYLEKNSYTERLTFEQTKNNVNQQLKKTKEQNFNIQVERKTKEREIQNYRSEMQRIKQENNELMALMKSMHQQNAISTRQGEEINRYKNKINHLESEIQELNNSLKDNQEKFERRYNNKKKEYKQKIEEYKNIILEMRNERLKTQSTVKRTEEDNISLAAEKKMSTLVKEHEKKIAELRNLKEKDKNMLQKNYEMRMKEMQNYYQKLLQNKIHQVEQNTEEYFQKMKQEGTNMRKYLQNYQQNYLPIAQFEEEISKRDELINIMKNKLQEFEATNDNLIKKEQFLLNKIRDYEIIVGDYKQKLSQNDELNHSLISKIKSYQQSCNIFKISDKKNKSQFQQYERLIKKGKQEFDDLKRNYIKLEQETNENQTSLRDKQRKIKDLNEELEITYKKYKKSTETIQQMIKQREGLVNSINQLKKQYTNLEYKLKDKQLTYNLNTNNWQSKINNIQLEIKDKNILMNDLQDKYQQMSILYQEQKKKNYQTQNMLKRFEMESKFYKQAGEMQKNQNSTSIEEFKRIISTKNEKIDSMQKEIEEKITKLRRLEIEFGSRNEKVYQENKNLRQNLSKLNKLMIQKLEQLKKDNSSIIEYIKSRSTIIENDSQIFKSILFKQIVQFQIINERQKQNIIKKTKNEMAQIFSNDTKLLKNQLEDKLKNIVDKTQSEKNAMKRQIKQKEEKIDELGRENKKLQTEIKKERDDLKNIEREYQIKLGKSQKQKESYEGKLNDTIKQMKNEKDIIMRQYEEKQYQMQHQIENLANTLKKLKLQAESINNKHEQQKASINSQLRTIKEQQQTIQKVANQKDLEIQRILRDHQNNLEAKRTLENQIRNQIETINKKIQTIHDLEIKDHQTTGQLHLAKSKCDRVLEENSELKRKLSIRQEQCQQNLRAKTYLQNELKDIKGALNRSNKNQQLRSLNQLSIETLQLSQKVNQMRKVNNMLDNKTPLRS